MLRLLAALILSVCVAYGARAADIPGTATYRERMALPPNAKFEAVIVDASRADAAAPAFARTAIDSPGQPPIAFTVSYDPAKVDPRARYMLRATISVDGKLWFTTDTATPVIAPGAKSPVDLVLRRVARPQALLDPAPAPAPLVGGMFRYFADAATLVECRTGREVPVAMEGGYRELERAYAARRSGPGELLYVTVEGAVASREGMEGPARPTLVVSRFLAAWPGETCERNLTGAPLADTYWKLGVLKGEPVVPIEKAHDATLILRGGPLRQSLATDGCNRTAGHYEATPAGGLTFHGLASTSLACPKPLETRERTLAKVLASTRAYAIEGPTLVLYDARREPLAAFQSVTLR